MLLRPLLAPVFLALVMTFAGCGGGGGGGGGGNGACESTAAYGNCLLSTPNDSVSVNSRQTGSTYTADIWVPAGYGRRTAPLPVVYALDAQFQAQLIVSALADLQLQAVVVAVPYLSSAQRATDFLRPGAKNYRAFLTTELMPLVESRYDVDPARRTLVGYSYSGAFVMDTLLTEDPARRNFAAVVATDPSIWTDPVGFQSGVAHSRERSSALPVRLYLSCAADCSDIVPLYQSMQQAGFTGFAGSLFNGAGAYDHGTVLAPTIRAGLGFAFGRN